MREEQSSAFLERIADALRLQGQGPEEVIIEFAWP
jgi:hypothetical protein